MEQRLERLERAFFGEDGKGGLKETLEKDEEKYKKLHDKYYRAIVLLETIVNFGKWTIRIGIGMITLIGVVKASQIWSWLIESFG